MRELDVADEVRALMSAEDLRYLAEGTASTEAAECLACRRPMDAEEPAAVVLVTVSPELTIANLAHPACVPSSIIRPDGPTPSPEQLGAALTGLETTAYARAGLLPHVAGDRPIVAVELGNRMAAADSVDRVDLVVSGLLEQGLHLHTALGHLPPRAEGWGVHLGPGAAWVGHRDVPLYEGPLATWPQWHAAVDQLGAVILLAGTFRLGDENAVISELRAAARAGLLVGGLVDVRA